MKPEYDQNILNAVREAARKVIGKPNADVTPATSLITDLQMESIDTIDLLFEIEKSMQLSINLADVFQSRRAGAGQKEQFDLRISEIVDYITDLKQK